MNANKAKGPDGLTGKIEKKKTTTWASTLVIFILIYSTYPYQLPPFPTFGKLKK